MNIGHLNGFECDLFEIRNGVCINKQGGISSEEIDSIYLSDRQLVIFGKINKFLCVLLPQHDNNANIFKNMIAYSSYMKRKKVLESLNI